MKRILWIVGLSVALLMFTGFVALCVVAFVIHKHLNLTGWTTLLINAYAAWFIFGRLRSAIAHGDPTKDISRESVE
jgi:hypothetical protein